MQHLDRRFEHFDEFKQPLRGPVEPARIRISVGIVLAVELELADIDLADQRGNILVVVIARLGLGDADLAQLRGEQFDDAELRNVAAEFIQPFYRPRAHIPRQPPGGNGIRFLQVGTHARWIKQPQRALKHRAQIVAGLEHINRALLHQLLEPFGERGFPPAHGSQEIEDLLAFFQALCRRPEIPDDALDGFFQPVEVLERRVNLERPVHENPAEPCIARGIDIGRLTDGVEHPLGGGRVVHGVRPATFEELFQAQLGLLVPVVGPREKVENLIFGHVFVLHLDGLITDVTRVYGYLSLYRMDHVGVWAKTLTGIVKFS